MHSTPVVLDPELEKFVILIKKYERQVELDLFSLWTYCLVQISLGGYIAHSFTYCVTALLACSIYTDKMKNRRVSWLASA